MLINKKIDELKNEIIKTTIDLVKVKSVAKETEGEFPYGKDVAELLKLTLEKCEELGFKTKNLDNYVGYAEIGEGEDYVVALGHLDVVPEGEGWKFPPYSGEISDGYIYGRGTADDKGPIVAALYGAKAIKDLGLKLNKRIRIVFGTSEEIGGSDIHHYLKYEKAPVFGFTPDAEFPIINGEKGIIDFDLVKDVDTSKEENVIEYFKGGSAVNVVPNFAECKIITNDLDNIENVLNKFNQSNDRKVEFTKSENTIVITAKGKNAHGSTPELGENAIMTLFKSLENINFGKETNDFIKFVNENIGYELNGEKFGVGLIDEVSGKLTLNVGIVDFNKDKLEIKINLRYPVTKKYDDVMDVVIDKAKGENIGVFGISHDAPLYFSKDSELVKKLQKVYSEQTGKEAELISIGGGTYAKEIPNTVAFGPLFPGEPECIHMPNEKISIENLIDCAKIYGNALYELAK
ncbi:MAG: dipeptidase PepV [Clostridium chrysemydis]|uniref:dipeptidase PepV n=1 Tax=Clostridium chrysemydis TaxID=2665504 RepID=UPI003F3A5617